MKAIDRRLRRLEDRFAPEVREEDIRLVTLLRKTPSLFGSKRGACESGREHFADDQNGRLSVADVLRMVRRRGVAPNEQPAC
jgi:hypothetical protein